MARKTDEMLNLDDLNLEELEIVEEAVQEAEKPQESKKKSTKKSTKKTEKKATKKKEDDGKEYIRPNQLADMLGTDGYKLRAWLRKTYPDHKKGTAWKWEKDSKELQEVIDTYKAYKNKPKAEKKDKKEEKEVEVVK